MSNTDIQIHELTEEELLRLYAFIRDLAGRKSEVKMTA